MKSCCYVDRESFALREPYPGAWALVPHKRHGLYVPGIPPAEADTKIAVYHRAAAVLPPELMRLVLEYVCPHTSFYIDRLTQFRCMIRSSRVLAASDAPLPSLTLGYAFISDLRNLEVTNRVALAVTRIREKFSVAPGNHSRASFPTREDMTKVILEVEDILIDLGAAGEPGKMQISLTRPAITALICSGIPFAVRHSEDGLLEIGLFYQSATI